MLDVCFTSVLQRAIESADIILSILQQSPSRITSPALNERDYGALNGRNKDEVALEFGEELTNAWRRDYEAIPPGGESLEMTCDRVWSYYVECIQPRLEKGEKVMVVSHGNTLRGLVKLLEKLSGEEVRKLQLGTSATRLYRIGKEGNLIQTQVYVVC